MRAISQTSNSLSSSMDTNCNFQNNNNDNNNYQQHINTTSGYHNQESPSFALDDINAIISSKEFTDIGQQQQQQASIDEYNNCYQEEQQQHQHPQYQELDACRSASIYEITRAASFYEGSNKMATETNQTQQQQQGKTNKNYLYTAYTDENRPYVEIVEQPAKCALRFRYKCEGRSAGSLPGANSSDEEKTYPSIKIYNYTGRAVVVVSCVTKDAPYRAHPHNLVGKEGCKKGICTIVITNEPDMVRSFNSIGIQCVKRKEIEESLTLRESINVDPFRNGFEHKDHVANIDLNAVRLCFQVFIEGTQKNKCDVPLNPVVSDVIHDKKAMSDLVITKLSHCSAPATGGREVILLCDRLAKNDVAIRFYEERNNQLIWENITEVAPNDVHKSVAICFKTPKYYNENIAQPVRVHMQLQRLSDRTSSEPRDFQFLPCESDEDIISRKRQKIEWVNMNHHALGNILQPQHQQHLHHHAQQPHQPMGESHYQPQVCHPTSVQQQLQQPQHLASISPDGGNLMTSPVPTRRRQHLHQQQSPQHQQHLVPSRPSTSSPHQTMSPTQDQHHPNNHQQQQQFQLMNNQQQVNLQQANNAIIEQPNGSLVVRQELVDNQGRVMLLVERLGSKTQALETSQDAALGNSLDGIHTNELMHDVNLGSGLLRHLNGNDNQQMIGQQQQPQQASEYAQMLDEMNCNTTEKNNC